MTRPPHLEESNLHQHGQHLSLVPTRVQSSLVAEGQLSILGRAIVGPYAVLV